ncbi:translation initiation factor IF-2-like [Cervus canadensis]|uniref:translation initiation factor IF-2-like n=1 Tax=Cervus canadensis TaxID=1574408 RepID=UPI001C9E7479|nr:translation initiation factor IF-2-like [Cervus canadensis]
MSIYGDLSERRAPIGPPERGTWGPEPGPAPRPHRPQPPRPRCPRAPETPRMRPRADWRAGGMGGRPRGDFRSGRRGGQGADLGAPPRDCRAPWGRARLHPETAWPGAGRHPEQGHQGGFPAPGWGRGGEGGGPCRPPLRHCGPGVPGESWGAVTSTLSGWEGADRPPPQPRPRRPQRRSWGTVVPDSTETGPVLPHPTHPAPQIAGPIVPRQGLHSGFGVTLFPLGRGWSFVSF